VTTTLFLVRHGAHDRLGRILCGRMAGVGLSAQGRAEAARVADRLSREPIAAVYASPLQRAQETAAPIAETFGLTVETEPGLDEIDFGAWTGKPLDELAEDPRWEPWCRERSLHRPPPGETPGESMLEAQARAARAIDALRARHPEEAVALVSHADLIKALLCHWLGLGLDRYLRFDVDPASVSVAVVGDWGAKVLRINEGVAP
jgi:probable phosphoglycerate mutase